MRIFLCGMGCVQIVTSVLILDDKVTSRVSDGANPDCVGCSTIITESNSCVRQDEHSHTISPQQEDSGMSRGSRDSAGGDKGSNPARFNNRDYTDVYHIVCGVSEHLTTSMSGGLQGGGGGCICS